MNIKEKTEQQYEQLGMGLTIPGLTIPPAPPPKQAPYKNATILKKQWETP